MTSARITPAQAAALDQLIDQDAPTPDRIVDLLREALDTVSVN